MTRSPRLSGGLFRLAALLAWLPAAASAAPPPKPENCGTIITEGNNAITSFNPVYADNLGNSRAAQLLFQPLVWVNRYGQADLSRSLVNSIQVSRDGTTYTLALRPWHWSNGRTVDAADVLYGWHMIEALGQGYVNYGEGAVPEGIKSVIALDATHIQITLDQPANPQWFIDNGLSQLYPLPAREWAKDSLNQLYQQQSNPHFFTVVDGPMRIQKLDVGMDAIFVPNTAYDGPKPHLRRLVLTFPNSDGAAVQQVEAGDLDFAALPLELYKATTHLHGVRLARLSPVSFWYYLDLNLRNPQRPFLRDVRVRQAMQDALNQNTIIALAFHGFGKPVYTAIPPVDAGFLAPALAKGNWPVGYNPAKARALLEQAGYKPGPDGIQRKAGRALSFTVLTDGDGDDSTEMILLVQAQLRAVGIQMKLRNISFNQMMQTEQGPPTGWDATVHGTYVSPYPTGEGLFSTGAGQNDSGYSDPEMDRLIAQSISQPGLEGLYAYEKYVAAQQPMIFLGTQDHVDLISDRVHGVDAFEDGALLAPDALYCTAPPGQAVLAGKAGPNAQG